MADIKLSLVNQALVAAGEDPVAALTGTNPMTVAAVEAYDAIVEEELEKNIPMFAKKVASPTLQTATSDAPLQYRWELPADMLEILSVLYLGIELEGDKFEIEGDVIRCFFNTDVTVKYTYRPPEERWTRRFRRIIVQRLESLFLRVTERHNEADGRDKDTERVSIIARHADSRQRKNRPLGDGSLVQARQGLRRRR